MPVFWLSGVMGGGWLPKCSATLLLILPQKERLTCPNRQIWEEWEAKSRTEGFTLPERGRTREVLQKGKGRSILWVSYHSDRQSQYVFVYAHTMCVIFLSHMLPAFPGRVFGDRLCSDSVGLKTWD